MLLTKVNRMGQVDAVDEVREEDVAEMFRCSRWMDGYGHECSGHGTRGGRMGVVHDCAEANEMLDALDMAIFSRKYGCCA